MEKEGKQKELLQLVIIGKGLHLINIYAAITPLFFRPMHTSPFLRSHNKSFRSIPIIVFLT